MTVASAVYLVEDDVALRMAVATTLRLAGLRVKEYESAEQFLAASIPTDSACLVVDVRLPKIGGLELQRALARRSVSIPIIFITGFGEVCDSVRAIRGGAIDFLEKPVSPALLLERVRDALERQRISAREQMSHHGVLQRVARLSGRERQVIARVLQGKTNKEISRDLSISFRTVEKYRALAMTKLRVRNVVEIHRLHTDMVHLLTAYPTQQTATRAS